MPTDLDRRSMADSATVVYDQLTFRAKVRPSPARWVFVMPYGPMYGASVSARPLQSAGCSSQSRRINSRLTSALADLRDAESKPPRQIRLISSRQLGAAPMDPWTAKNDRRLRLVEKKHAEGLTLRESRELDRLKREVYEHLQAVDPRPADDPDEIDQRFERLKKRIEAKKGKKV